MPRRLVRSRRFAALARWLAACSTCAGARPQVGARVRARGAAEDRSHAGHELVDPVRLGDVVVGTDLEADDGVELGRLGGHHDDRHRRIGPDRPADVDARQPGEHHVEQHEVGPVGCEPLERLDAVARDGDRRSLPVSRFTVSASTKDSSSSTTRTRAGGAPRSSSPGATGRPSGSQRAVTGGCVGRAGGSP